MNKSIASENHQELCAALAIRPDERVLEVGGGHNPVFRADVVVDIDFDRGLHRDGQSLAISPSGQCLVLGDLTALPFSDQAFDVVLCLHVLEHVPDPAAACRELMRVARRGFLETPRKWTEYYAGHPTHLWLIDDPGGVLIFEPLPGDDFPFRNFALPILWTEPPIKEQVSAFRRDIPCVQLYWEGEFSFQIVGPAIVPDVGQLARRHYNFCRNLLRRLVPPARVIFHAQTAAELEPGNEEYQRLYTFLLLVDGQWRRAWRREAIGSLFWQGLIYRGAAFLVRLGRKLSRCLPVVR